MSVQATHLDAIPVILPRTVCKPCVLLKHSGCVNYDDDAEDMVGGCICPSARHQKTQAEIVALEAKGEPRGRSLDDLLEVAFRAGHKRGLYVAGTAMPAPDYPEWRRALTAEPEPPLHVRLL